MIATLPQFPDAHLLTHSSEACFKQCPRKYFLRHVLGLRPRHDATALRFGSAWHLGVGHYESGNTIDDALKVVRGFYFDQPCPPYFTSEDYAIERETCVAMVRGHYERWQSDAILETIAVELSFDLPIINPLTNKPTPLKRTAGKIDRIARLPDGRLALVERKTTSDELDLAGDYWKRLQLDSQISRYFLAAHDLGYDVQTIVYDVQRKPAIRPKAISKADRAIATSHGQYHGHTLTSTCPERETPELYAARLTDDMRDRQDFYFARAEIPRLDSDIEEFKHEQWVVKDQVHACESMQDRWGASAWPRNTDACTSPYRCVYLDVCRGMSGDPTEQIPDGFKIADVLHPELVTDEGTGT